MISYNLTIYPKLFPEQDVYKTLLEAIPPGKFYLLAPITVPYTPSPLTFVLHTDAWDQIIKIWVNGKEQQRMIPLEASRSRQILSDPTDPKGFHIEVEVPLILDMGENLIHVEIDNGQAFDLVVVANPIASLYKGYSTTLFDQLLYPLQQQNDSLMSPWSPELMESLLRFQPLLPDLRIPKTHAIKLAVRAMMAHSGTNLGVQAFATALAYNNPYVTPSTSKDFLDLTYDLVLQQDEISGSEFHLWIPSKSEIGWLAFSRLIYNIPRVFGIKELSEAENIFTDLLSQNRQEDHQYFFQNRGGPDFWEIIKEMPRMRLTQLASRKVYSCIGLYRYRYPLGLKVLYPIGNRILGRRPRHLGPIEATVNFSGMVTTQSANPLPVEVVVDDWGVNPPTASKLNTLLLADDGDLSYIYHGGGGGATESFRFDFSSIPDDATSITVSMSVVARGVGTSTNLRMAFRSGVDDWTTLWQGPLTPSYTTITSPAYSLSMNMKKASYLEFGFIDNSSAPNSLLRITQIKLVVTYVVPLKMEVMSTSLTIPVTSGMSAVQLTSMLASKFNVIKGNLGLITTQPSSTSIDVTYSPILDVSWDKGTQSMDSGKALRLKSLQTPQGVGMWFESIRGRELGANDGVDLWAAEPHGPITVYFTDPVTRLVTPKTFTPEIGFLGHSLTSTRMSGTHQQGIPAQWGSMSGYYPSSRNIGVGSVVGATKRFTFPSYTFQPEDVGKNLVITRATTPSNLNKVYVITSIISPHIAECANAVVLNDTSISAKLIYKCGERRPIRVRGPQARLLTTSRLGCVESGSTFFENPGFITSWSVFAGQTITLPVGGVMDYEVNWGDGSPTEHNGVSHRYTADGSYYVEIKGTCTSWSFELTGSSSSNLITAVVNWGSPDAFSGFDNLYGGFFFTYNMTSIPSHSPILAYGGGCTDFTDIFLNSGITSVPSELFSLHPNAHRFDRAFESSRLVSIPANLFAHNTVNTSFNNTFAYCTSLTSIPAHLFDLNPEVIDFTGTFQNCWSVTSIPAHLFDLNTNTLSFNTTFSECLNLSAIPPNLFDFNTKVTDFGFTFYRCRVVTSIPVHLFDHNPEVTNFSSTFALCQDLTSIPANLFDFNPNVVYFISTFRFTGITSIPAHLFDLNPNVVSFNGTFESCASLASITPNIFDLNTQVVDFSLTFSGCRSVVAIPPGLFYHNSLVTDFRSTFDDCETITSIPSGLFDQAPLVTNFYSTFSSCFALTSVPQHLFDHNPEVLFFDYTFFNSSSLSTVPADLFYFNTKVTSFSSTFGFSGISTIPAGLFSHNTLVTSFEGTFRDSWQITTIPAGLFDNNPLVTSFSGTFGVCLGLTSIPSGLFDNNPLVTDFTSLFGGCSSLASIPAHLFDHNPNVERFGSNDGSDFFPPYWYAGAFYGTAITTIPSGLFDFNLKARDYSRVFSNCPNLTSVPNVLFPKTTPYWFGSPTIFAFYDYVFEECPNLQVNASSFYIDGAGEATRFVDLVPSFAYTFNRSSFSGVQGKAPDLWACTFGGGGIPYSTFLCFGGLGNTLASLSNYASIPVDWRM